MLRGQWKSITMAAAFVALSAGSAYAQMPIIPVFNNMMFAMNVIAPLIAAMGFIWAGAEMIWQRSHGGGNEKWISLLVGSSLVLGAQATVNALY